jgi:hypothetical protein
LRKCSEAQILAAFRPAQAADAANSSIRRGGLEQDKRFALETGDHFIVSQLLEGGESGCGRQNQSVQQEGSCRPVVLSSGGDTHTALDEVEQVVMFESSSNSNDKEWDALSVPLQIS